LRYAQRPKRRYHHGPHPTGRGTRGGAIDPGVLLYLQQHGMSLNELERVLYQESGLLGVSGLSADMRVLLASDDPRAAEAIADHLISLNSKLVVSAHKD